MSVADSVVANRAKDAEGTRSSNQKETPAAG
jgi:hypothetical protein